MLAQGQYVICRSSAGGPAGRPQQALPKAPRVVRIHSQLCRPARHTGEESKVELTPKVMHNGASPCLLEKDPDGSQSKVALLCWHRPA